MPATFGVHAAMRKMRVTRGRERQFRQVFDHSPVPMLTVDNERRYVEANAAARLLFRMSLAEFRTHRIDDLTPLHMLSTLYERWAKLMGTGSVAGPYDVGFLDGSSLRVVYCALANALPGEHLIVFAPADWPGDELAPPAGEDPRALGGSLSPREREVLTLIASGAGLEQIAEELTISPTTVRTHTQNILRKLGARNRPHAIALAMAAGLIDASPDRTAG